MRNNTTILDAVADAGVVESCTSGATTVDDKVHVRVHQRNGQICITTISGLSADLAHHKISKAMKKHFHCNNTTICETDPMQEDIIRYNIQLSGDRRIQVRDFLVHQEICTGAQIVLHGF